MIANGEVLAVVAVGAVFLFILYKLVGGGFSLPLGIDQDPGGPEVHGWDHCEGDGGEGGGGD